MSEYTDLPESICPHCGYAMDAASNADGSDARPTPGSISICIQCSAILEFDNDLKLIALTDETLADIDDETMAMINSIRSMFRGTVH